MCGFLSIDSSEYPMAIFDKALHELDDRGPDMTRTQEANGAVFGFNRLSIMDLSEKGMQPFNNNNCTLVCNGEIYNYPALKENLADDYECQSHSDCEVLLPLYQKYGLDIMCKMLDGEFAFSIKDAGFRAIGLDIKRIRES